ncbi:MAG TPA: NUDIX domain-containing protein [Candidatus Paceibacterota bacterium]|nr:NUDIX domain-containing protein [Candidatus Paceibacterota bacterium]
MKQTTLCFLRKGDKVLLAMKKRGFGMGKWNGVGGKVGEGEDVPASAIREIKEEIGVDARELESAGVLEFRFREHPEWAQDSNIFVVRRWRGAPSESEEMRPRWYAISELPFEKMWIDDPYWLPLVLAGKKIKGRFLFGGEGETMLECEVAGIP